MDSIKLQTTTNNYKQLQTTTKLEADNTTNYEAKWDKYTIVSLGTNCFPRIFCTRTGLKPNKAHGELSMPFDLVASYNGFDKTLDLLENDFQGYFDKLVALDVNAQENKKRCSGARQEHPEAKIMFANDDLKSGYVHDGSLTRGEFIKRYTDRINNFRKVISGDRHVFFFVARYDSVNLQAQIERCCSVLDKICKQIHSLIVYAPYDLSLSVDRKDVLILKKGCRADYVREFGSYIDDMGVRHRNATEPGMPAFSNVTKEVTGFIDRRLAETEISERKAEIISIHNITDGDKLTE